MNDAATNAVLPETSSAVGPESPVISVQGVSFSYGSTPIVKEMSLEVRAGERVAILGATGAGKSTLLNLLIGTIAPQHGTVEVCGFEPWRKPKGLNGKFAIAFQSPRLLPWRTAFRNVSVGLEILGVTGEERRRRAQQWLDRMGLGDAAERFPAQLSGGMRQRVSLARAFVIDPEVIFLDEAFSALDEVTADVLRRDFRELSVSQGTTAVVVTHNIDEAMYLADRVIVLARPAQIVGDFSRAVRDWSSDPAEAGRMRAQILDLMRGSGSLVRSEVVADGGERVR
jgi:NitT/TauT family transport system ATP-binding protein